MGWLIIGWLIDASPVCASFCPRSIGISLVVMPRILRSKCIDRGDIAQSFYTNHRRLRSTKRKAISLSRNSLLRSNRWSSLYSLFALSFLFFSKRLFPSGPAYFSISLPVFVSVTTAAAASTATKGVSWRLILRNMLLEPGLCQVLPVGSQ